MAPAREAGSGAGRLAVADDLETPQVLHVLADVRSIVVDVTRECIESSLATTKSKASSRTQEASEHVVHAVVIGHVHSSSLVSAEIKPPALVRPAPPCGVAQVAPRLTCWTCSCLQVEEHPHPHRRMSLFELPEPWSGKRSRPLFGASPLQPSAMAAPDHACVFSSGLFPARHELVGAAASDNPPPGIAPGALDDGDSGSGASRARALRVRLQMPLSARLVRHSKDIEGAETASHGSSAGSWDVVDGSTDNTEVHAAVGEINVRYDAGLVRRLAQFFTVPQTQSRADPATPAHSRPDDQAGGKATPASETGASGHGAAGAAPARSADGPPSLGRVNSGRGSEVASAPSTGLHAASSATVMYVAACNELRLLPSCGGCTDHDALRVWPGTWGWRE